jgi:hypothetical protein
MLFKVAKLREISLIRRQAGHFELTFWLENQTPLTEQQAQAVLDTPSEPEVISSMLPASPIPDYVSVEVAA